MLLSESELAEIKAKVAEFAEQLAPHNVNEAYVRQAMNERIPWKEVAGEKMAGIARTWGHLLSQLESHHQSLIAQREYAKHIIKQRQEAEEQLELMLAFEFALIQLDSACMALVNRAPFLSEAESATIWEARVTSTRKLEKLRGLRNRIISLDNQLKENEKR